MDINTKRRSEGLEYKDEERVLRPKATRRSIVLPVLVFLGVVLYFVVPMLWFSLSARGYQAVFLTNGQVYFGKMSLRGEWLKLSDIYYLQAADGLQQGGGLNSLNGQTKIQLIKLGSELHGPADEMLISKDKVLFWENMEDNSKVLESIKDYKTNSGNR